MVKTAKEFYDEHYSDDTVVIMKDYAKMLTERMYSEEDMREAFKGGSKMCWTDINQETQEPYYYDFKEWFEQFKKIQDGKSKIK